MRRVDADILTLLQSKLLLMDQRAADGTHVRILPHSILEHPLPNTNTLLDYESQEN